MSAVFELSREQKVAALLESIPGIVHFGLQPLSVFPNKNCKKIKLHLLSRGILNLESVTLIGPEDPTGAVSAARMSSAHPSSSEPAALLKGRRIHTTHEPIPFWEVEFTKPVNVQEIRVGNRIGVWGGRSYGLNIDIQDEDGRVWNFDNLSTSNLLRRLQQFRQLCEEMIPALYSLPAPIRDKCGTSILEFSNNASKLLEGVEQVLLGDPTRKDSLNEHRVGMLRSLNDVHDALAGKELLATLKQSVKIIDWLLPRAAEAKVNSGVEEELHSLAWLFVSILSESDAVKLVAIKENDRLLADSARIRVVEDKVNKGYAAAKLTRIPKPIMFRAHGLGGSKLFTDTQSFVQSMKEIEVALEKVGYQGAICYGTFLGAVRDKGFIPHDDDVDMAVALKGPADGDFVEELKQLIEALKSIGVEAGFESNHQFLKVRPPVNKRLVDLFPIIPRADGAVGMYMQQLKIRDVPKDVVLPFGSVELYGETFKAPASADGFLTERYGSTWQTPQRTVGSKVMEV